MVKTIGMGEDARTDGSWEQDAKRLFDLEAVADAARAVFIYVTCFHDWDPCVKVLVAALDVLDAVQQIQGQQATPDQYCHSREQLVGFTLVSVSSGCEILGCPKHPRFEPCADGDEDKEVE